MHLAYRKAHAWHCKSSYNGSKTFYTTRSHDSCILHIGRHMHGTAKAHTRLWMISSFAPCHWISKERDDEWPRVAVKDRVQKGRILHGMHTLDARTQQMQHTYTHTHALHTLIRKRLRSSDQKDGQQKHSKPSLPTGWRASPQNPAALPTTGTTL